MAEIRAALAPSTPLEVWFQDEMRVGQKNKLTYRWARKGSRPRAAHDQRTQSTYLFGAVCPERGAGAALVLPACNTEAMQLHLDEIACAVASSRARKERAAVDRAPAMPNEPRREIRMPSSMASTRQKPSRSAEKSQS